MLHKRGLDDEDKDDDAIEIVLLLLFGRCPSFHLHRCCLHLLLYLQRLGLSSYFLFLAAATVLQAVATHVTVFCVVVYRLPHCLCPPLIIKMDDDNNKDSADSYVYALPSGRVYIV